MNTDANSGPLASSAMSARDLATEAAAGLFTRPGRTMLTVVGTVIGLTALVATLGLSRTAGNRIVGRFDELAATEVVVNARPGALRAAGSNVPRAVIPWDAESRVRRLNGVVSAGTLSVVDVGRALVSSAPINDPSEPRAHRLTVRAASAGLFRAVRAQLRDGVLFDDGHSIRADRVAVLGRNAALRLGVDRTDVLPSIRIGDESYLVMGIVESVARQPDLASAVIIPEGTARRDFRLETPALVEVETRVGAAPLISAQLPLVLRPDNPRALRVVSPPEPKRAREGVKNDLNLLFLALGAVSLIVGAIGIANVTMVSVIERTGEIGLRRALGASRRHIAQQFLAESTTIGIVGGVIAASLGTLLVVAISARQGWTPVLDPTVALGAPLVGGITGLLSGTYPAVRAARLAPVDALRSGT